MFKYRSCGKINSFLNVLSEMSNGYHKINTHYQLIDIFDDIEFTENDVDKNMPLSKGVRLFKFAIISSIFSLLKANFSLTSNEVDL